MGAGDVTAQLVIEKKKSFDFQRTAQFSALGVCFVGPGLSLWYSTLDRHIIGSAGKIAALKKMLLDQGVFAPVFLGGFLVLIGVLQNQAPEDIKLKLEQDYMDIMKTNWMIWPAFQLINFHLIPLQHRVPAAATVAFFWNTYLAWKANK